MQQWECPAEINIHPPRGLENLVKPAVLVFPTLLVCADCGFAEFVLDHTQLKGLSGIYDQKLRA